MPGTPKGLAAAGEALAFFGGADRDRTGDLLNAIQARSQLRYRPIRLAEPSIVTDGRNGRNRVSTSSE